MARCYTFTTWNVLINFGQRTKLSLFSETFALLSAEGMNDEYSYLFIDVGCLCFGHFLGCQLLSNVFRLVVEEFEFNLRAPSNAVHLSTKPNCSHILLMVLPRGYAWGIFEHEFAIGGYDMTKWWANKHLSSWWELRCCHSVQIICFSRIFFYTHLDAWKYGMSIVCGDSPLASNLTRSERLENWKQH